MNYVRVNQDGSIAEHYEGKPPHWESLIAVPEDVSPFHTLVNGEWVAPEPTPATDTPLNRVQFRAMMTVLGLTYEAIETAIDAAIIDTMQNAVAKAKLHETTAFHRDNQLFALLAPVVGLTDEQIDTAWAQAVTIE